MPQELFNETGIQPIEGILDDSRKIYQDDDIDIKKLVADYAALYYGGNYQLALNDLLGPG